MRHVCVTGAALVSALGPNLDAALDAWETGRSGLEPPPPGAFPEGSVQPPLCGRIADRTPLRGRRYGAASNLAVHVARCAVHQAGWSEMDLREASLFGASSRGNAGELLRSHGWRRPVRSLVASNTLHSEIAAAVSIELGIEGPWQMLSNGCSSGLDALGLAWRTLAAGWTSRALVIASELPLVPELLRDFAHAGLLARDALNNLLALESTGFYPAEAGVAITLESCESAAGGLCRLTGYLANSDAYDSLASPPDGKGMARLLAQKLAQEYPALVCTHSTGTRSHAISELAALQTAFRSTLGSLPPVLPLKTLTGHTLGASGLVDVAMLAAALSRGRIPGLPPTASAPPPLRVWNKPRQLGLGEVVWKTASGMGGHNALVSLQACAPEPSDG
jgi:3-oxoacyl-[acyl-carrier-protein] synthase II